MEHTPEDLKAITDQTLAYYDQNAQDFWEGTRDHDVSQNIDAMLNYIGGLRHLSCLTSAVAPDETSCASKRWATV